MDTKQIEMVMKLIRLANNNPNDNEANLAARKACKMLENHKFDGIHRTTTPDFKSTPPNAYSNPPKGPGPFDDFEANFWRGYKQQWQQQQENRNQPPKPPKDAPPGRNPPGSSRSAKQGEREEKATPHADSTKADPFADFKEAYYDLGRDFWPGENIKRNLKCSKCGYTKSTRFRGIESMWICMECRGKEYTGSKL